MEAAIPLLAEQGYRGASLASIASAANLTQQGLLHHFGSKQELLMAVLEARDDADRRRVASLRAEGLGTFDALESLVEHNAQTPEQVRFFTTLVAEGAAPDHPAHEYFVNRYERVRGGILSGLLDEQLAGEIRQDANLESLVSVIVAVMDGLQIQWLLTPEIDMVALFESFVRVARAVVAAPGAGR